MNYEKIIKQSNDKILNIVFTNNPDVLSKEEILFREKFIGFLERKYSIQINDVINSTDVKEIDKDIVSVSINQKKDLFFIFKKHDNQKENDFKTIEFSVTKEEDKFVGKNRGRTFFVITTKENFIVLNTKDYYDLFLIKDKEKNIITLTSIGDEIELMSGKLIKKVFRSMKITK